MLRVPNLTFLAKRLLGKGMSMSAFTQKLNPITGKNDWVIQSDDYDYHQEVARASFADMLHDTERNEKYEHGLKWAIETMHAKGLKANVLDIGTGTGLLSMMAVRHGADSVVACEAFTPMSKCALEIIALNGYENNIKVIPKRSTDLLIGVDMPQRANILVTEVFDTELIGEGAISTFTHAHDVLLEPNSIVVPHLAKVYAQVVGGPLIRNWNRLKDVYDDDGKLILKIPDSINSCQGSINLHDIQLSQIPKDFINIIAGPTVIYEYNFSDKELIHPTACSVTELCAERDGEATGVFMWWSLQMDDEEKVELSCAPYWVHPLKEKKLVPWRDHWMQAVYYLPTEKKLNAREIFNLQSCHDEYSLWFKLQNTPDVKLEDCMKMPGCTCSLHMCASPTRIGQLNDGTRIKKYVDLITKHVGDEDVVLVTGHGHYLGLVAARLAKKVVCVDSNSMTRRLIQDFCDTNSLLNVEIVEGMQDLKDVFTVVLSEPYFTSNILPWDNLFYMYLLRDLKDRLDENVKIFPGKAVVMAVAVKFDNLHKIRAPLGTCQGFNMEPFDKLIEASSNLSDDAVEAQPLWEYPSVALSEPQEIATFNIKMYDEGFKLEQSGVFKGVDGCNGIALWVNWIFDDTISITTGPIQDIEIGEYITWDMHSRQGVTLFGARSVGIEIPYNFKFNCDDGNFSFNI